MPEERPIPIELSSDQIDQLRAFLHLYGTKPDSASSVSVHDQSGTAVRDNLESGFGIELSDPQEYYRVMAVTYVATEWMSHFMTRGDADPETARYIVRTLVAGLAPEGLTPTEN